MRVHGLGPGVKTEQTNRQTGRGMVGGWKSEAEMGEYVP